MTQQLGAVGAPNWRMPNLCSSWQHQSAFANLPPSVACGRTNTVAWRIDMSGLIRMARDCAVGSGRAARPSQSVRSRNVPDLPICPPLKLQRGFEWLEIECCIDRHLIMTANSTVRLQRWRSAGPQMVCHSSFMLIRVHQRPGEGTAAME